MTEQKFKTGDKVRFAGTEGVVKECVPESKTWSYGVEFEGQESYEYFDRDGAFSSFRAFNDRLTLIERPKRMVKRTMWMAIRKDCLNQTHCYNWVYDSKDEALKAYDDVIGAYPVEVELFAEGE